MPDRLTLRQLATVLREPQYRLLGRILQVLGEDRATELLVAALLCAHQGGLPTLDGTRQRSMGGIFLTLVKERTTAAERQAIFRRTGPKPRLQG